MACLAAISYHLWAIDRVLNLDGVIWHVNKLMGKINGTFEWFQIGIVFFKHALLIQWKKIIKWFRNVSLFLVKYPSLFKLLKSNNAGAINHVFARSEGDTKLGSVVARRRVKVAGKSCINAPGSQGVWRHVSEVGIGECGKKWSLQ